jgi:glycerate-2-kinase
LAYLARAAFSTAAKPLPRRITKIVGQLSECLNPRTAMMKLVRSVDSELIIGDKKITKPAPFIALGKPALEQALAYLNIAGSSGPGLVVLKKGLPYSEASLQAVKKLGVNVVYGNHPNPGEDSCLAACEIKRFIQQLPSNTSDLVALVTGGTTALISNNLEAAKHRSKLMSEGHSIEVLNTSNKEQELLHGGLAAFIRQEQPNCYIHSLILNDVAPNGLHLVGSGPTIDNHKNSSVYELHSSEQVKKILETYLEQQGYVLHVLPSDFLSHKEAEVVGNKLAWLSLGLQKQFSDKRLAFVADGEAVVSQTIQPGAIGGRCSLMAASAAKILRGSKHIDWLSLATDGDDGNTRRPGFWVNGKTATHVQNLERSIQSGNSGEALICSGYALPPQGEYSSNVRDLVVGFVGIE